MPQLAPVNWLFLFTLFWFVVAVCMALLWWSFKTDYSFSSSPAPRHASKTNFWPW